METIALSDHSVCNRIDAQQGLTLLLGVFVWLLEVVLT